MKRFKILAVIAIVALAGGLIMACGGGDSDGGGGGTSPVSGWQGGSRPGGGGSSGTYPGNYQVGGDTVAESEPHTVADILNGIAESEVIEVVDPTKSAAGKFILKGASITLPAPYKDEEGNNVNAIEFIYKVETDPNLAGSDVTFSIPPGMKAILSGGIDTSKHIVINSDGDGGAVEISNDSSIGNLTITKGTVNISVTGDTNGDTVTLGVGIISIPVGGALIVGEDCEVQPTDVNVNGILTLDGDLGIAVDKTITLYRANVAGPGNPTPNDGLRVDGTGTLTVAGKMVVAITGAQSAGNKNQLIPLAEGARAVFGSGSTLTLDIYITGPTTPTVQYAHFGDDTADFDISDSSAQITVTSKGSGESAKTTYTIDGTVGVLGYYPADAYVEKPAEPAITLAGAYQLVNLYSDLYVNGGAGLTVGGGTTNATALWIAPGYTLTLDAGDSEASTTVAAATLDIADKSIIFNYGTITNGGEITVDDEHAYIINNGSFTNSGTIAIEAGTLYNEPTFTIANTADATITISSADGALTNKGTITNAAGATDSEPGLIKIDDGALTNDGTITNNGDISFEGSTGSTSTNSSTITNGATGSIAIAEDSELTNDGTITNSGDITIGGTLTNAASKTITNQANATILIEDNGTLANSGTINNQANATITIGGGNSGTLTNAATGVINNAGTMQKGSGATTTNTGGSYNPSGSGSPASWWT